MRQAAQTMQGKLTGTDAGFRGVGTDSRRVQAGELFFALRGPTFDGADFVPQALADGAAGAVSATAVDVDAPWIRVRDTRVALGRLGQDWRRRMSATVIGITGSNGKTTLKELLAHCLAPVAPTLATEGNLNNDIGLPLMLSRLSPQDRYAVLEMGANHAGEIAWLAELAEPDIVAITNAGPAHLEGFGSLEGVATAKGEILQGARRPATAVLNADDEFFPTWRAMAQDIDILTFGYSNGADIRIRHAQATGDGIAFDLDMQGETFGIRLPLPGLHNAMNACCAAAVALAAGLRPAQVVAGLRRAVPVSGRLCPLPGLHNARLFDDSYNANPASVIAAAQFVAAQPGRGWLVLGDMGELGNDAAGLHAAVGADIRDAGVERLYATGPLARHAVDAFGEGGQWYGDIAELIDALRGEIGTGINVLVKGSRSMRMERVVQALAAEPAAGGQ
ncbi:MAG: UDP-N-acetylmuramoyl-tripeptide--D-alanyl-D-alanine ligase [Woeseiaceae bacterium]|nr:UDP-N-acetylmuramoyl-tripeptide--D-alanyl-D-alanine ligase [Woeseiaceae bacterium]